MPVFVSLETSCQMNVEGIKSKNENGSLNTFQETYTRERIHLS